MRCESALQVDQCNTTFKKRDFQMLTQHLGGHVNKRGRVARVCNVSERQNQAHDTFYLNAVTISWAFDRTHFAR